jgi:hypothetical protein
MVLIWSSVSQDDGPARAPRKLAHFLNFGLITSNRLNRLNAVARAAAGRCLTTADACRSITTDVSGTKCSHFQY